MSHVLYLILSLSFVVSFIGCKPRDSELSADDAALASKNYTYDDITFYYALREPWLLRFKCLPGQVPPNCAGWERMNWTYLLSQIDELKNYAFYEKSVKSLENQKNNLTTVNLQIAKTNDGGTKLRLFSQKKTLENSIAAFVPNKKLDEFYDVVSKIRTIDLPFKEEPKLSLLHNKYLATEMIKGTSGQVCVIDARAYPVCWGVIYQPENDVTALAEPIASINQQVRFGCAIDITGNPICRGELGKKVSNDNSYKKPLLAMAASDKHLCVIDVTGSPFCWGPDNDGNGHGIWAARSIAERIAKYEYHEEPLREIAAGTEATCSIDSKDRIKCWDEHRNYGGIVATAIAMKNNATCVITKTGELTCPQQYFIVRDDYVKPVLAIEVNFDHVCIIDATGSLVCGGNGKYLWDNWAKEHNKNPYTKPILATTSDQRFSCIVDALGKVFCVGVSYIVTGRDKDGYKLGPNVPEDVDLSLAAHGYVK